MKLNKPAAGVALIQVLFIAAILSLVALHFTLSSRQQVEIAQALQDKVQAELRLKSQESRLLYTLLTSTTDSNLQRNTRLTELAAEINFYGKPFALEEGVTARLQDVEGLISLVTAGKTDALRAFLLNHGMESTKISQLVAELEQRQRVSLFRTRSTGPGDTSPLLLQSVAELQGFTELPPALQQALQRYTTVQPNSRFSPMHAPEPVLQAVYAADLAEQLIASRAAGSLTPAVFASLSRIEDYESYSFVIGNRIIVELEARYGSAVAKKRFICYIRPDNRLPLIWLD